MKISQSLSNLSLYNKGNNYFNCAINDELKINGFDPDTGSHIVASGEGDVLVPSFFTSDPVDGAASATAKKTINSYLPIAAAENEFAMKGSLLLSADGKDFRERGFSIRYPRFAIFSEEDPDSPPQEIDVKNIRNVTVLSGEGDLLTFSIMLDRPETYERMVIKTRSPNLFHTLHFMVAIVPTVLLSKKVSKRDIVRILQNNNILIPNTLKILLYVKMVQLEEERQGSLQYPIYLDYQNAVHPIDKIEYHLDTDEIHFRGAKMAQEDTSAEYRFLFLGFKDSAESFLKEFIQRTYYQDDSPNFVRSVVKSLAFHEICTIGDSPYSLVILHDRIIAYEFNEDPRTYGLSPKFSIKNRDVTSVKRAGSHIEIQTPSETCTLVPRKGKAEYLYKRISMVVDIDRILDGSKYPGADSPEDIEIWRTFLCRFLHKTLVPLIEESSSNCDDLQVCHQHLLLSHIESHTLSFMVTLDYPHSHPTEKFALISSSEGHVSFSLVRGKDASYYYLEHSSPFRQWTQKVPVQNMPRCYNPLPFDGAFYTRDKAAKRKRAIFRNAKFPPSYLEFYRRSLEEFSEPKMSGFAVLVSDDSLQFFFRLLGNFFGYFQNEKSQYPMFAISTRNIRQIRRIGGKLLSIKIRGNGWPRMILLFKTSKLCVEWHEKLLASTSVKGLDFKENRYTESTDILLNEDIDPKSVAPEEVEAFTDPGLLFAPCPYAFNTQISIWYIDYKRMGKPSYKEKVINQRVPVESDNGKKGRSRIAFATLRLSPGWGIWITDIETESVLEFFPITDVVGIESDINEFEDTLIFWTASNSEFPTEVFTEKSTTSTEGKRDQEETFFILCIHLKNPDRTVNLGFGSSKLFTTIKSVILDAYYLHQYRLFNQKKVVVVDEDYIRKMSVFRKSAHLEKTDLPLEILRPLARLYNLEGDNIPNRKRLCEYWLKLILSNYVKKQVDYFSTADMAFKDGGDLQVTEPGPGLYDRYLCYNLGPVTTVEKYKIILKHWSRSLDMLNFAIFHEFKVADGRPGVVVSWMLVLFEKGWNAVSSVFSLLWAVPQRNGSTITLNNERTLFFSTEGEAIAVYNQIQAVDMFRSYVIDDTCQVGSEEFPKLLRFVREQTSFENVCQFWERALIFGGVFRHFSLDSIRSPVEIDTDKKYRFLYDADERKSYLTDLEGDIAFVMEDSHLVVLGKGEKIDDSEMYRLDDISIERRSEDGFLYRIRTDPSYEEEKEEAKEMIVRLRPPRSHMVSTPHPGKPKRKRERRVGGFLKRVSKSFKRRESKSKIRHLEWRPPLRYSCTNATLFIKNRRYSVIIEVYDYNLLVLATNFSLSIYFNSNFSSSIKSERIDGKRAIVVHTKFVDVTQGKVSFRDSKYVLIAFPSEKKYEELHILFTGLRKLDYLVQGEWENEQQDSAQILEGIKWLSNIYIKHLAFEIFNYTELAEVQREALEELAVLVVKFSNIELWVERVLSQILFIRINMNPRDHRTRGYLKKKIDLPDGSSLAEGEFFLYFRTTGGDFFLVHDGGIHHIEDEDEIDFIAVLPYFAIKSSKPSSDSSDQPPMISDIRFLREVLVDHPTIRRAILHIGDKKAGESITGIFIPVFEGLGLTVELLYDSIKNGIEEAADENVLFRSDNVATKTIRYLLNKELVYPFLVRVMSKEIEQVINDEISIYDAVERVLLNLEDNIFHIPVLIKFVLQIMIESASTRFENASDTLVVNLLFLRLIIPGLSFPEKYGLHEVVEDIAARKRLVNMSRLLQSMANGSTDSLSDNKQEIEFKIRNFPRVKNILDRIAKYKVECYSSEEGDFFYIEEKDLIIQSNGVPYDEERTEVLSGYIDSSDVISVKEMLGRILSTDTTHPSETIEDDLISLYEYLNVKSNSKYFYKLSEDDKRLVETLLYNLDLESPPYRKLRHESPKR